MDSELAWKNSESSKVMEQEPTLSDAERNSLLEMFKRPKEEVHPDISSSHTKGEETPKDSQSPESFGSLIQKTLEVREEVERKSEEEASGLREKVLKEVRFDLFENLRF